MLLRTGQLTREETGAPCAGAEMKKYGYAGLFTVSLATLMHEILLTRIFSVTMWYHFAFMAISLAMFGMSAGAVWVYLFSNNPTPNGAKLQCARSSLLFGISAVISLMIHCASPFLPGPSLLAMAIVALTYVVFAVPFFFSGVSVCLALTRFPGQVSKLYAADLAGAASGCVLLVYTLRITDAPTAVALVALLASISAAWFAADGGSKSLCSIAIVFGLVFAAFVAANTVLARNQRSLLRLMWVKGGQELRPLYEHWNSFSRIAVTGDPNSLESPLTEGVSRNYPPDRRVRELFLTIDASAETTLTAFDGDFEPLEYLKYDVKNLVHYLRPDSKVLVVGAGGGRDVLAALAFGQKSVRAVEINEDILDTVNKRFGAFTGHLDRNPKVTFVNDEARSYIARLNERFDIIQISFIDTWAATAAGAFTLTENSLYTLEAWKLLLERLTSGGVLSVSRWYSPHLPGEAYRLISLAAAAMKEEGAGDPRQHIVLVRNVLRQTSGLEFDTAGTLLLSRSPFSETDLNRIEEIAKKMQFEVIVTPRFALNSIFLALASGRGPDRSTADFPLNLSPPTDDSPFFFNMLRFRDTFNLRRWSEGNLTRSSYAVLILGTLLIIVAALSLLVIVVPLAVSTREGTLRGAAAHLIFFAAIGLGFMLVEVSQMQRLIVFLGHPTYALSVVLFALLVSSGLGSYSTERVGKATSHSSGVARLLLLLVLLSAFGIITPYLIKAFEGSTITTRILAAVGILFPIGLGMGMAFPLGLKLASSQSNSLTPWLWGINGATSVFASVVAVAIALDAGISASFWVGVGCYLIAFGVFIRTSRARVSRPAASSGTNIVRSY